MRRSRTLLLICLLVAGLPRSSAQYAPERLDSVMRLLDPSVHDTDQIDRLELAADSWFTSEKAYPFLARLDSLSNELLKSEVPQVARRARRARGTFHYYTGYHAKFERNIPLALRSFKAALLDFGQLGAQDALADTYDALGVLLRAAGDPLQAISSFSNELNIARERRNGHLTVQALVHLAACHADRGDLPKAHTFLDSCTAGNNADRSAVLNERARLFSIQGRSADALRTLERSLELASRTDNEWDELPVLTPLARVCYASGAIQRGLSIARQCADVAQRMNDLTAECGCLVLAGQGERALGLAEQAETDLREAMALARTTGNIGVSRELGDEGSMIRATGLLKDLLTEQGRYREAREMTQLWADMKDSVLRMNGRDEVMMFHFQKAVLLDSITNVQRLERERRSAGEQIAAERYRRNLLALIGIVLAIFVFALWTRWRLTQRANAAILKAQHRLLESERQREAEQVRTGIARDVHDALGSDIAKIAMLGSDARAKLKLAQASEPDELGRIGALVGDMRRSLNDIVWSVDPTRDSALELMAHARAHAERSLLGTSVAHTLEFEHDGVDVPIGPAVRRDLFLSLKEALNNALKYAHAQHISVCFKTSGIGFHLEVRDDGIGFNTQLVRRSGNGLRNLQARAVALGAELCVESSEGMGTTLRITGPWPQGIVVKAP